MSNKEAIFTDAAPRPSGTYSPAIKVDSTVYLAGQIPLDPNTMELVPGDICAQAAQAFKNLAAVCVAAGGSLDQIVKLSIFLTDLTGFAQVNEVMANFFSAPYPARTTIQVSALPKQAMIELEAIMVV